MIKTSRDILKSQYVTWICLSTVIFSIVAYLYFLNVSVVHVVMRKEAMRDIHHLQTEIAMLEASFIEAQHNIASRVASLEGFELDAEKIFIERGDTSLVLRDN